MQTIILMVIMMIVVLGPAAVIAVLGNATIKALGRNPSSASKIFMGTIVFLVAVVVISIIALLVIFHLFAT